MIIHFNIKCWKLYLFAILDTTILLNGNGHGLKSVYGWGAGPSAMLLIKY